MFSAVGLAAPGPALAQLGPLPGLSPSSLGQPNGPAALDSHGNASALAVLPQGALLARPLSQMFAASPTILDFGAKCDGTTDDSGAVAAAAASGKRIAVPVGLVCNAPSIGQNAMPGVFSGPGQIKTSDGNLRGPLVSQMTTPPSRSAGLSGGVTAGFNGDLSHTPIAIEHRVTGAATLGQPTTGYVVTPEASADLINSFNTSGFNSALSGPAGRTGLAVRLTTLGQYGQGDMAANYFTCFVSSILSGSTSFLENAACSGLTGQLVAGAPGVYLQGIGDINLSDGGFDVAGIGSTIILNRSKASASQGTTWVGDYQFSTGSVPVDAAYSAAGPFTIVLDTVDAASTAAVAAGAGQRLYLDATQPNTFHFPSTVALGTEYIDYNASSGIELVVGGKPILQAVPTGAVVAGHLQSSGPMPTVSGCGTSTVDFGSTDNRGSIAFAGSPTQCTLNFAASFAGNPNGHPVCTLTFKGTDGYLFEYGDTATTLIFGQHAGAALTGHANYICL